VDLGYVMGGFWSKGLGLRRVRVDLGSAIDYVVALDQRYVVKREQTVGHKWVQSKVDRGYVTIALEWEWVEGMPGELDLGHALDHMGARKVGACARHKGLRWEPTKVDLWYVTGCVGARGWISIQVCQGYVFHDVLRCLAPVWTVLRRSRARRAHVSRTSCAFVSRRTTSL